MSAAILSTNPPRNSLFIGDLSIFCTEDDLRDLFSPFGELLEIKIMKSEDKGRSLSYGFVKFSDPACASRALNELQHKLLHGRNLRIAWASYKSKGPGGFPQPDNLETSAVHVSFISYQIRSLVTEASLRVLFSRYGEVSDVSIKKSSVDKNINRQSGYGFVHFPINPAGISAAIKAAEDLQDTTVEEVNYKSSLSHKLTVFIEENSTTVPSTQSAPKTPAFQYPANPVIVAPPPNSIPRPPAIQMIAPPLPPPISQMQVPVPHPPPYPLSPQAAYSINHFPIHAHQIHPPTVRISAQTEHQSTFVVAPVITHLVPAPPSIDYYHRSPYEPPQPYPNAFVYQQMSSPAQSTGSPQFYINENMYCMTPSSISSIDTLYDHMIGNLLVSPSEPQRTEQYGFAKRSSPSNNGRLPASSNFGKVSSNNRTVNLKKVRDRSLRSHFNELDTKEVNVKEKSEKGDGHDPST